MPKEIITERILCNPSDDPFIEKVLTILGRRVKVIQTVWSKDDIDVEEEFIDSPSEEWLGCIGGGAIGSVCMARNEGDDLILTAHYGDGLYEFSMLNTDCEQRGKYNTRPGMVILKRL